MEEGQWDEANKTKVLLEEKQRAVRRKREQEAAEAISQGVYRHFSCSLMFRFNDSFF
jgi:hypothetical protein